MKTPEGYEKDDIKKYLNSLTNCWFISPFMAGYGKSGVPDIIGCVKGRFFSIEVKREGKEPTPIQTNRIAEITMAGGVAFAGTAGKVIPDIKRWVAKLS